MNRFLLFLLLLCMVFLLCASPGGGEGGGSITSCPRMIPCTIDNMTDDGMKNFPQATLHKHTIFFKRSSLCVKE